MNLFEQLKLHVDALSSFVDSDGKFFAAVKHYVKQFQKIVHTSDGMPKKDELQLLAKKIDDFYEEWRPSNTPGVLYISPQQISDSDSTVKDINTLVKQLVEMGETEYQALSPKNPTKPDEKGEDDIVSSHCVFIGHGRSKLWARVKLYLQDELSLATVSYESETHAGESIVPVLEKMLEQATFAILILTAEDETAEGAKRARQNVVHEAGLFQGRLGVCPIELL